MITPDEFPYIKSLHVNDCYAYKDFDITLHNYKPFSHLILTGKNGSGKSTILRAINNRIYKFRQDNEIDTDFVSVFNKALKGEDTFSALDNTEANMVSIELISSQNKVNSESIWSTKPGDFLYSYLKTNRRSTVSQVETPTKESDFIDQLNDSKSRELFVDKFLHYLVTKKINQAFDQLNSKEDNIKATDKFFLEFTKNLRRILDDDNLELIFNQENFNFLIKFSNEREVSFNTLPDGFSAFLSILMDLFVRVDLIRKKVNNYTYDPCGIVLIDEPETHLHLQLQEQVLPLLTSLFPNIQFVAATHSPAVIASIKNATIFDLTTKESRGSEDTVGRSYSDLMMSHFGLNNEYSAVADAIINEVNKTLNDLAENPVEQRIALQRIYDENSAYLAPTLKIELELLIAQHEAQQVAHQ